jgi:peptidyl-prolyl cis-trans isomerase C
VDPGKVLARIDDHLITVDDVEKQIQRQPAYARARYASADLRKEMLDNLVRFEVMAREAEKRGYDKDPDVLRSLKQQMVNQMVQREFEAKLKPDDVPEAEARKYYEAHPVEFHRADEVRVSQILVKEKVKATKVLAEAKALPPANAEAFRALVAKYSIDETSKLRGGDLLFFDRQTLQQPKTVVEAAFALKEPNDLSPVIESDKGFHILKLSQKRTGFTRSFTDAKPEIQRRLLQEGRSKRMKDWSEEMRKGQKVEVFEDRLKNVKVNPPPAQALASPP